MITNLKGGVVPSSPPLPFRRKATMADKVEIPTIALTQVRERQRGDTDRVVFWGAARFYDVEQRKHAAHASDVCFTSVSA